MDLDLITNGSAIRDNITSLNNGKFSWIVLGYTNNKTLNIIETGDNSFEDMFEEFDNNKIMYGFASVVDPNSKLKKNVFIHWQGEAAPQSMKTMSVQHASVIRDLCKPVHVTHHARDDQDLDLKEIMTKVASASGANYSCHSETKKTFTNTAPVKSEENTAANARQTRLKELSSLGSLQKESFEPQNIGSNYEKVNAMDEIKNLRNKKFEGTPLPKPVVGGKYTKTDAAKEIKSSYNNNNNNSANRAPPLTFKGVGKIDASKEINSFTKNTPVNQNTSPGYKKINPQQELKSLTVHNNKTMFENKAKVESENNTAQRVKEERQKELSSLFSKKNVCPDDDDQKVGTNYSRINPVADIQKLRSLSISHDEDAAIYRPKGNYTKIDPNAEIQILRRMSSSEVSEPISPGSSYKKINPAEEIKKLRSQSTFTDIRSTNSGYKKINPIEEISSARKASISTDSAHIEKSTWEAKPSDEKQTKVVSARKTFENAHKANNDPHQPHKTVSIKTETPKIQNAPISQSHTSIPLSPKVADVKSPPVPAQYTPVAVEDVKVDTSLAKEQPHLPTDLKNTARTLYRYCANDTDEISFDEEELIQDIEIVDDNWWIGVNAVGNRGMFPSEYVVANGIIEPKEVQRSLTPEPQHDSYDRNGTHGNGHKVDPVVEAVSVMDELPASVVANTLTAVAIYDYQANDNDEINFDVGEIIKEIEQIDEGWWIGVNKEGQRGMFPSNFVEITTDSKQDIDSPVTTPHSNSHVLETVTKQQPEEETVSVLEDSMTVRAIYDYSAHDDDEISFAAGDVIERVAVVDDGWWEGECQGGRRGLFPSNYVEPL